MGVFGTTKMSAKGRVVIPETIREKMGLTGESEFIVLESRGTIVLKTVSEPVGVGLKERLTRARAQTGRAGLKKSDIRKAILRAREIAVKVVLDTNVLVAGIIKKQVGKRPRSNGRNKRKETPGNR